MEALVEVEAKVGVRMCMCTPPASNADSPVQTPQGAMQAEKATMAMMAGGEKEETQGARTDAGTEKSSGETGTGMCGVT